MVIIDLLILVRDYLGYDTSLIILSSINCCIKNSGIRIKIASMHIHLEVLMGLDYTTGFTRYLCWMICFVDSFSLRTQSEEIITLDWYLTYEIVVVVNDHFKP